MLCQFYQWTPLRPRLSVQHDLLGDVVRTAEPAPIFVYFDASYEKKAIFKA